MPSHGSRSSETDGCTTVWTRTVPSQAEGQWPARRNPIIHDSLALASHSRGHGQQSVTYGRPMAISVQRLVHFPRLRQLLTHGRGAGELRMDVPNQSMRPKPWNARLGRASQVACSGWPRLRVCNPLRN